MQIDFFQIGLKKFKRPAARKSIRKYRRAPFIMLSANTKGEIRDQFFRLGLNPTTLTYQIEDNIEDIIIYIGVWTCRS